MELVLSNKLRKPDIFYTTQTSINYKTGKHTIYLKTNSCWLCGSQDKKITKHHVINKSFNPKYNILIPLCKECHKKLHSEQPYWYKHMKDGKFRYRNIPEGTANNNKKELSKNIKLLKELLKIREKEINMLYNKFKQKEKEQYNILSNFIRMG
jgi:tRNA G26 N,N-dimethylase Trm1